MEQPPKLDRRKAKLVAQVAGETRRYRRVPISLRARMAGRHGTDHPCVLEDVSIGGALVHARFIPRVGETVLLHIESIGQMRAEVMRTGQESFSVSWPQSPRRKERLAEILTWLHNAKRLGLEEDRGGSRDKRRGSALVAFPRGETERLELLDVSPTGLSFRTERRPEIGTELKIGRLTAKVTRHRADGFAVQVTGRLDPEPAPDSAEAPEAGGEEEIAGEVDAGAEDAAPEAAPDKTAEA